MPFYTERLIQSNSGDSMKGLRGRSQWTVGLQLKQKTQEIAASRAESGLLRDNELNLQS